VRVSPLVGGVVFLFIYAVPQAVEQIRRNDALQTIAAVPARKRVGHGCIFSTGLCKFQASLLSAIVPPSGRTCSVKCSYSGMKNARQRVDCMHNLLLK
jgi:hypothetical protein